MIGTNRVTSYCNLRKTTQSILNDCRNFSWIYQLFASRTRVVRFETGNECKHLLRASKLSRLLMEPAGGRLISTRARIFLHTAKKSHARVYITIVVVVRRTDRSPLPWSTTMVKQITVAHHETSGIRPRGFLRVLNNRVTETRGCIWPSVSSLPALYTLFRISWYATQRGDPRWISNALARFHSYSRPVTTSRIIRPSGITNDVEGTPQAPPPLLCILILSPPCLIVLSLFAILICLLFLSHSVPQHTAGTWRISFSFSTLESISSWLPSQSGETSL